MNRTLQLHALYVLTALAGGILFLIWHTLGLMASSARVDGKVYAIDAGQITGLTLMFREVIGRIQSIWEHGERADMTAKLADSSPTDKQATGKPNDPIHQVEEKA